MSDISIFTDKTVIPTKQKLKDALGSKADLLKKIEDFVFDAYPDGLADWNFPGKKYGWSYRIKDKKRAIIYFLPREGYFKVAFVFGQRAFDQIIDSDISSIIKDDLAGAKKFAEGRGISIDVRDSDILQDIFTLVGIKLAF
jgi:hypothetical protein